MRIDWFQVEKLKRKRAEYEKKSKPETNGKSKQMKMSWTLRSTQTLVIRYCSFSLFCHEEKNRINVHWWSYRNGSTSQVSVNTSFTDWMEKFEAFCTGKCLGRPRTSRVGVERRSVLWESSYIKYKTTDRGRKLLIHLEQFTDPCVDRALEEGEHRTSWEWSMWSVPLPMEGKVNRLRVTKERR